MTSERLRQIEELYHAANERDPGEREHFLAGACHNDEELRGEVLSLLAQDGASGPINQPLMQVAGGLLEPVAWEPGARVGPYQIISLIGEGGMGQVYKAMDTRLARFVALKVAHAEFSGRFQREARAISALNHPNICTLHDIGPNYLVMEFVEGETLAKRLQKGCLSTDLTLSYGVQIAKALVAAHAKGIVHRDLKPANVIVTKAGIKVLDFGLAKLIGSSDSNRSRAETATVSGAIIGTPAYMSPEQLEGKECDTRTDIFALGLVLFEMIAGRRSLAAHGAAIEALENTPPQLTHVIERCLSKEPDDRWQSAHDLALELAWIQHAGGPSHAHSQSRLRKRELAGWVVAVAVFLVSSLLLANLYYSRHAFEQPLTRLTVDLGPNATTGVNFTAAISPDGRRLVFPAREPGRGQLLATRLLDQTELGMLYGTESGSGQFFSPDGKWIGFFADQKLKKIPVLGGAPSTLCNVTNIPLGATWGSDGTIVFAPGQFTGLSRIPSEGGLPKVLTKVSASEIGHRWPQFLPNGETVLFTASLIGTASGEGNIEAVSLKTGQVKIVQHGGYFGRYLPSGHLVYIHEGTLFGVEFDVSKMEVRGTPVPLLTDLIANDNNAAGHFDFSSNVAGPGMLVYSSANESAQSWQVSLVNSSGDMQRLIGKPGAYLVPRFSPDGRKLATIVRTNIVIYDQQRDATAQLTYRSHTANPIWTPDGAHIVFAEGASLQWIRADGAGEPRKLWESQYDVLYPHSFSPDGGRVAYCVQDHDTGFDLWTLPLDLSNPEQPKAGKPELFLRTPADELLPRFSPDGHWIAYRSNESGRNEIYVRQFPAGNTGRSQISTAGGLYAFWSGNGRELFYETADYRIMALDYTVRGDFFVAGKPRPWLNRQLFYPGTSNLDLAPDGKRFAVLSRPESDSGEKGSVHVTMLLNFFDEVRRRVAAK